MAQAHLSSLDMSSVDKEDPSSEEEEGEQEKECQQRPSNSGGQDRPFLYPLLAFLLHVCLHF